MLLSGLGERKRIIHAFYLSKNTGFPPEACGNDVKKVVFGQTLINNADISIMYKFLDSEKRQSYIIVSGEK
jgi:hypothetical protein